MRNAVCAVVAIFSSSVTLAADVKQYELDGGVTVSLSDGWSYDRVQSPAMKMAAVREMVHGASEIRMRHQNTAILVSYMHFKSEKPEKAMDPAELETVGAVTTQAASQYLRQSRETAVTPRSQIAGMLGVSLATLTARPGQSFNVASGVPGKCVTTGNMRRGAAAWAISIASEDCQSDTHREAVEAFFAARSR